MLRRLSIRHKLFGIAMVISMASLLLASAAFFTFEVTTYKQSVEASLGSLAEIIGANSAAALVFGDRDAATETLKSLSAERETDYAILRTRDGKLFASYHREAGDMHGRDIAAEDFSVTEPGHISVVRDIVLKGKRIGSVNICSDLGRLRQVVVDYLIIACMILLLSCAVAGLMSLRLQKIISAPLTDLTLAAGRIGEASDYSVRVRDDGRHDEIGILVRGFNGMLDHIKKAHDELSRAHVELERRVDERTRELQREVSERWKAENQVRTEKEMLHKYLDLVPVLVVGLDRQGIVTLINRRGCELLGYTEEETVGHNWFDLAIPQSVRSEAESVFRKLMAGEVQNVRYHENVIAAKGGRECFIAWHNTVLIDELGRIVGTLSAGEDITERQKLAEDLRKAQRLESIGTFAGGIAHDFNNFLMAIIGNVELAKNTPNLSDQMKEFLSDASEAASSATGLTRQLLTFSKGGQPVMKIIDMAYLARKTTTFVLTGSNIRPQFTIPDGVWRVNADPGQMEQVITNIVVNAKQAMPEGGNIHVSVRNIDRGEAERSGLGNRNFIETAIRDEGIGIPGHIINKIFDPYFTTKQEGSGLGLATSYSIVTRHGGKIAVESQVGRGTTFFVYLAASENRVDAVQGQTRTVSVANARILVMDDDERVGRVILLMLRQMGCHTVWARDGEEAVRLFQQARSEGKPYDIMILDIVVQGGMGGKETAREILALDPSAVLVASSAYSNEPVMADFRKFGFAGAVSKPYKQNDLLLLLSTVVRAKAQG